MTRRRTVLKAAGVGAVGVGALGALPRIAAAQESVFAHGVASGDPLPDAVLLWTRVTADGDVAVGWEVALDAAFVQIAASGEVTTGQDRDHTVKFDATGLRPSTSYFYRFTAAGATSPTGRTRTAPAPGTTPPRLRFGVASCANWQHGFFSAYRHLAEQGDLDAVIHLGDYLYEYGADTYTNGTRDHDPATEIVTLDDYRRRHAQYKTDPDLQALHAAAPFVCTWDDHESANDAYADGAENHDPATEGDWLARRAAAYRAYFEWMPVRSDGSRIHRRLRFGDLAELSMLDLRTFRDIQTRPLSAAADDPARSITGAEQLEWLIDGLTDSDARWKLVGNPVMISPLLVPPLPRGQLGALLNLIGLPQEGGVVNTDQWDGYAADRRRVLDAIRDVDDVVFLTGDIHSTWANEVPLDAGSYPLTPAVATEFVVTSVTSDNIDEIVGVPRGGVPVAAAVRALNRHVRHLELDSHGAGLLTVTPGSVRMDFSYVADRTQPGSPSRLARSFRVDAGRPRILPA